MCQNEGEIIMVAADEPLAPAAPLLDPKGPCP